MKTNYLLYLIVVTGMLISGCATSKYYKLDSKEFDDFDYGFTTKNVKVRNVNVAVIDEGKSDQVIVLIHGLGTNMKCWIKNIPALSQKYRVIAVDLVGYGKSDKGYYPYSMPFHATVIAELLDAMNIEKATLVGHSMGGQIAMTTALNYPDHVDKLVLISPAGFEKFTDGEGAWMKKAVTPEAVHDTQIRTIDINLKSNFYKTPKDADFFVTERIQMRGAKDFDEYCYAVSKNVAAMIDYPVWDNLENIKHKTLIIFGENDGLIPNPYLHGGKTVDVAKIGQSKIPNNQLIMIPKCGHLVPFEKFELVNEAIARFMEGK